MAGCVDSRSFSSVSDLYIIGMKTTKQPLYTVTTGSPISVTSGLSPVVAICAGVGGGLVILVIFVVVLVVLCRRAQSKQLEDIVVVYISSEGNSSSYFYL